MCEICVSIRAVLKENADSLRTRTGHSRLYRDLLAHRTGRKMKLHVRPDPPPKRTPSFCIPLLDFLVLLQNILGIGPGPARHTRWSWPILRIYMLFVATATSSDSGVCWPCISLKILDVAGRRCRKTGKHARCKASSAIAASRRWQGPAVPKALILVPTRELSEQAIGTRLQTGCASKKDMSTCLGAQ